MTKFIDAEKLKTEIERQIRNLRGMAVDYPMLAQTMRLSFEGLLSFIASLQQEQDNMIQWTGNNLKEVIDFTGKCPKFGEWFKSWEEYENYVHTHNDTLKLFCEDGSHYEVPAGAWIVKTPDGHNVPSIAKYVQQEQPEGGCSEKPNDLLSEQEPTCKDYTHFADVGKMEQPEVDLELEIERFVKDEEKFMKFQVRHQLIGYVARHFYELGKNARKED